MKLSPDSVPQAASIQSREVSSRAMMWSDWSLGCTLAAARKEQGAALGGGGLEGSVPDPDLDLNRVEVMGCRGQT